MKDKVREKVTSIVDEDYYPSWSLTLEQAVLRST